MTGAAGAGQAPCLDGGTSPSPRRRAHQALLLAVLWFAACSKSEPAEVEVEIRSVGVDAASHSPVVVLQDKEHRSGLPIWIGPGEAQAIAMQLEGVHPPRPMTHDLMKDLLVESGVDLRQVVIADIKDRTYFAKIRLVASGKEVEVDSRPSDAIALAVRFKKPILVSRSLLNGETAIDIRKVFGSDTLESRGVTVQAISSELVEALNLDSAVGVLVSSVGPEVSGLRRGDRIVAVNGLEVADLSRFAQAMDDLGSQTATLHVERGGERFDVPLPARD